MSVALCSAPLEPTPTARPSPAAARIRSAVYGAFVAFAAAFVLLSVKELVVEVFGYRAAPVAEAPPGTPERACADGIRELSRALDRGALAAAGATDEKDAVARLGRALSPEWDRDREQALAATCTREPNGAEAWAALLRLRRAEEGAAGRHAVLVGPLKAAVARLAGTAP